MGTEAICHVRGEGIIPGMKSDEETSSRGGTLNTPIAEILNPSYRRDQLRTLKCSHDRTGPTTAGPVPAALTATAFGSSAGNGYLLGSGSCDIYPARALDLGNGLQGGAPRHSALDLQIVEWKDNFLSRR